MSVTLKLTPDEARSLDWWFDERLRDWHQYCERHLEPGSSEPHGRGPARPIAGSDEEEAKMIRCDYAIWPSPDKRVVVIIDDDLGRRSVTNDADAVVSELHRLGYLGKRVLIYRDSEGVWDQICHDGNGRFLGFEALRAFTLDDALARIRFCTVLP